ATLSGRVAEVDGRLERAAEHWRLERLAATDRSVLRAAAGELIARPGTPARIILDEAIELAKRYGSEQSGRSVNGVLDPVGRSPPRAAPTWSRCRWRWPGAARGWSTPRHASRRAGATCSRPPTRKTRWAPTARRCASSGTRISRGSSNATRMDGCATRARPR